MRPTAVCGKTKGGNAARRNRRIECDWLSEYFQCEAMRIVKGSNGLQERQRDVAMGTSSSNSAGPFDVSAYISAPGERDAWMPTPLLRRPSDPLSNRTKFLIASAIAALLAGPFVFGSSDRPVDVAVAPQPTIDAPPP